MTRISIAKAHRPIRREAESILRRESADLVWSLQVFSPADSPFQFGERNAEADIPDLRTLFALFVRERAEKGDYDQKFAKDFQARGEQALDEAIRAADLGSSEDSAA